MLPARYLAANPHDAEYQGEIHMPTRRPTITSEAVEGLELIARSLDLTDEASAGPGSPRRPSRVAALMPGKDRADDRKKVRTALAWLARARRWLDETPEREARKAGRRAAREAAGTPAKPPPKGRAGTKSRDADPPGR
jgi:hypothetical protein